jgi:peptidoglycan/LPS O-acetylase OafA/YrhL
MNSQVTLNVSTHHAELPGRHETTGVFYSRIEALRGVAALSVAIGHTWLLPWFISARHGNVFSATGAGGDLGTRLVSSCLRIIGNGSGAVVLFFVISGFVLSASLVRGRQDLIAEALRFAIARLFRIYPAVFVTIVTFAAVLWATDSSDLWRDYIRLLLNVLLIETSIDPVTWTLQLEILAIPLIFVTYLAWQRWGAIVLGAACCVLIPLSFSPRWNSLVGTQNAFGEMYAFVVGMAAFLVAPRIVAWLSPRGSTIALTIAAALFLVSREVLGLASYWSPLAESIFASSIVALLAFGRPGGCAALLDVRLIRFFGRISYSFYLLHYLILSIIWKYPGVFEALMGIGTPPTAVAVLAFAFSVAVVTPLAFAMYRFVERPGVAIGRRLTKSVLDSERLAVRAVEQRAG